MATLGVFFVVVLISLAIVRQRAILLNLTKPYRTFDLQFDIASFQYNEQLRPHTRGNRFYIDYINFMAAWNGYHTYTGIV